VEGPLDGFHERGLPGEVSLVLVPRRWFCGGFPLEGFHAGLPLGVP
jgi:hypothetical protein